MKASKKVRVAIVVTLVWLIGMLVLSISSIPMGFGIDPGRIQKAFVDYILLGVLPVVIGWGIWWIRNG